MRYNLGIVYGGRSTEHEVSLVSAENVYKAVDKKLYNVSLIKITKKGDFLLNKSDNFNLKDTAKEMVPITMFPSKGKNVLDLKTGDKICRIDVVFPVLHGTYGEDGTIQGFLEMLDVPYVGPGVLGSSVCINKVVTKKLLNDSGILSAKYVSFKAHQKKEINFSEIVKKLKLPLFLKPANLGSSVGICKIKDEKDFNKGLREVFKYDNEVLIEECIKGREIECAVLGNEKLKASVLGEVIPSGKHDFYDYDAKYKDAEGAILLAPAKLPKDIVKKVQDLALRAFVAARCEGMSRVDFFVTPKDIYFNEINTIPGFTNISMYPRLFVLSGIKYVELVKKLVSLALERHKAKQKISTNRDNK